VSQHCEPAHGVAASAFPVPAPAPVQPVEPYEPLPALVLERQLALEPEPAPVPVLEPVLGPVLVPALGPALGPESPGFAGSLPAEFQGDSG